jgi:hypothetical protein
VHWSARPPLARISNQFFPEVNFSAYGESPSDSGTRRMACLSGELNRAGQSIGRGRDDPIGSGRADQHQAEG